MFLEPAFDPGNQPSRVGALGSGDGLGGRGGGRLGLLVSALLSLNTRDGERVSVSYYLLAVSVLSLIRSNRLSDQTEAQWPKVEPKKVE